jgi:hypothetical protein
MRPTWRQHGIKVAATAWCGFEVWGTLHSQNDSSVGQAGNCLAAQIGIMAARDALAQTTGDELSTCPSCKSAQLIAHCEQRGCSSESICSCQCSSYLLLSKADHCAF